MNIKPILEIKSSHSLTPEEVKSSLDSFLHRHKAFNSSKLSMTSSERSKLLPEHVVDKVITVNNSLERFLSKSKISIDIPSKPKSDNHGDNIVKIKKEKKRKSESQEDKVIEIESLPISNKKTKSSNASIKVEVQKVEIKTEKTKHKKSKKHHE